MEEKNYYVVRWWCTLLLLLIISTCSWTQTITQLGVAYKYNGKKQRTPLGNVTVSYDGNKRSAVSGEQDGVFTLTLNGYKIGDRIGLVSIKKREMMVFNQHAVDEWNVRKDPLCLILCNTDEFERQKQNLINIGRREAKKKYDEQKAKYESKLKANEIQQAEYEAALNKAYEELENLYKSIGEYAELFARIDESEIDTVAQQAMDLYNQGKVEKAIHLFEQGNYMEKLEMAIKTSSRADELKKVAEQTKERSTQDSLLALQSLKAQIEAYKIQGNWTKANYLYGKVADMLKDYSTYYSYAHFCNSIQQFDNALKYLKLALSANEIFKNDKRIYIDHKSRVLDGIGRTNLSMGQYENSLKALHEALNLNTELQKMDSMRYNYNDSKALILEHLAQYYNEINDTQKCSYYYKEALIVNQKLYDNRHMDDAGFARFFVSASLLNIDKNEKKENCIKAVDLYKKLIKQNANKYEGFYTAAMNRLAFLCIENGDTIMANQIFTETLPINQKYAEQSPIYELSLTANLLGLYAVCPDSVNYLIEAVTIYERMTKRDRTHKRMYADLLTTLGDHYISIGRKEYGVNAYEKAMNSYYELSNEAKTEQNIKLVKILLYLGEYYGKSKSHEKAECVYSNAVTVLQRLYEIDSNIYRRDYINALLMLGASASENRRYQIAYESFEKVLPLMKILYESNKEQIKDIYVSILGSQAFYAIFMKRNIEAEHRAREAILVDPEQHFIYTNLAPALLFQGKYAEAELIYRQYKEELKDFFLNDFKQFNEAGVIPPRQNVDVERIKRMLVE